MRSLVLIGVMALVVTASVAIEKHAQHLQFVTLDGTIVWSAPIADGEPFDISFVHSHEQVVWTQHYVATVATHIRQVASTFPAFGAGMPVSDSMTTTRWTAAGYVADARRDFTAITFMNSRPARMTLHYRNQDISLSQWFHDYESFIARVR